MFKKASNHIEIVGLSLRNYGILAFICLNGLKTSRFNVMTQYFQQIPHAQNILPKMICQSYDIIVVIIRRDHIFECFCLKTLTTMIHPALLFMGDMSYTYRRCLRPLSIFWNFSGTCCRYIAENVEAWMLRNHIERQGRIWTISSDAYTTAKADRISKCIVS